MNVECWLQSWLFPKGGSSFDQREKKKQLVGYDDADYQPTVTDCKGVIIQLKIIIQYSILTIQ